MKHKYIIRLYDLIHEFCSSQSPQEHIPKEYIGMPVYKVLAAWAPSKRNHYQWKQSGWIITMFIQISTLISAVLLIQDQLIF
jgi:hypothetical protein